MTDAAEKNFLAAQATAMQDYGANGGMGEGGADNSDSEDDYDPSATLHEDYSVPFDVSEEKSTASVPNAPTSVDASFSHALPSTMNHRPSSTANTQEPATLKQFSSSNTLTQNQPRTKGGFVVDDDDEDDDDEDTKDMLDVYETPNEAEANATAFASGPQSLLNSSSTAPVPIHDAVQTPVQANTVSNGASGVVPPSATVSSSDVVAQRGNTVTPLHTAPASQANIVPIPETVNATPTSAGPKTRLAHDTIGILEDRIKEDPRGDMAAWLELIDELKRRNKKEDVRRTYDNFFKVFPLAAEQWVARAEWENESASFYNMEQIFTRSLLVVPDVKLWSLYVSYIRRRNSMTTGDINKSYKIISDSFNFALNNVGMDKDSGRIWQDYIDFVKSGPGDVRGTGWQDTQKVDALRAAYQKAISVPMSALNLLWKEYDSFETGLSKINGRKFLQERSPAYMTARTCYTQLQNMTKDLDRTTLPKLPPAFGFEGDTEYMRQVEIWKSWIQWEKDDNLVLKDEDIKAYRDRIIFVYKQALMALQFWPEMWYDAADFCFSCGMDKEGLDFLNQGIAANPESCLLAFKLADQIELTTANDETSDPGAKLRMQKVREPYNKVLDSLYELITKARAREVRNIQKIEANLANSNADMAMGGRPVDDEDYDTTEVEQRKATAQVQIDSVKSMVTIQVSILQKAISFAWVALMRACRRIQGKGMPGERAGGFRTILTEARKKGRITSDVYIQSALIEYHCYKDNTATKIFERGIKLFPDDEIFALEYIKHLIAINDVTNARAVFETTVGRLTANPTTISKARPIFSYLHEYESHFGELSQVARLEQRMRDLYPEDQGLKQFSQRFVSSNFDPTSIRPIVSAQQIRPKGYIQQSIEAPEPHPNSPPSKLVDAAISNSPKRPFPGEDFEDQSPRKLARGESPLKGAAGRRMDQQKRQNVNGYPTSSLSQAHAPPPSPLPGQINFLLSIIPKASTYLDARFDPVKMVELMRDVRLPPPGSLRQPEHQPSPSWPPPPQFQQQQPPVMHSAFPPPGQGMGQPQYTTPFRYG